MKFYFRYNCFVKLRFVIVRGRRMRNSVNVGLGAGGAMVETGHNVDSRPSSTDSCKSTSNTVDPNNSMSFKDVLVQFAKLSQQQGMENSF